MAVFKLVSVFILVLGTFFFDVRCSVSLVGQCWSFPVWALLSVLFLFVYICKICRVISDKLSLMFGVKPDVRRGVNYLQEAFSGMLVKDHKVVWTALSKARKHLGNIPFISWLEGQLHLVDGDIYKAKSLFFNLSSKEKNTVLGAYSLAQLSLQNGSDKESVEAIKAILKIYPNAQTFISRIISLSAKNGNIDDAFYYLRKLSDDNKQDIKSVLYFEKWKQSLKLSDLKESYKLAPQISDIAIMYADELVKLDEKKSASKVLLRSFEKNPSIEVFKKYVSVGTDKVKRGEKLLQIAQNSWIPYYCVAKLCEKEGIVSLAFDCISRAYELAHYSFIADELVKINAMQNGGEDLIDLSQAKNVKFEWRCRSCGSSSSTWISICPCCLSIASYSSVEVDESKEKLPTAL